GQDQALALGARRLHPLLQLQAKFRINREINVKSIEFSNSGSEEFENYDVKQLEKEIDKILSDASKYFRNNPDMQHIIKKFGKLAFLGHYNDEIYNNDTGLNDNELKKFLKMYDRTYKAPVKRLLMEYYRVLHNPNMEFEGTILDKLNFKPCSICLNGIRYSEQIKSKEDNRSGNGGVAG
ncbi:MAG: hypothetical protein ABEH43_06925, partial [Flavobacteriales bacterium]